jgi:hypothetical protein
MWTDKYIGVPYSKMDCAEFVEFVANSELGLTLRFPKKCSAKADHRSELLKNNVAVYSEKLSEPVDKCAALLMISNMLHVGLVAVFRGKKYLLHSNALNGSSRLDDLSRYDQNILGFYLLKNAEL